MDFGAASASPGGEDASLLAPKAQTPADWTEGLDWTIQRSAAVRRIYANILSDPDYKARDAFLNERFAREKAARKALRQEKQLAYAEKHARRRPHSSQFSRVNAKRFVVATIRQSWDPVFIEGQQFVLRLPDADGNIPAPTSDDEDPVTGKTPLDIVRTVMENCRDAVPLDQHDDCLHWRIPLGTMQRLLESESSALSRPRLLRHLRLRSCSWDLLLHEHVSAPHRGRGKGSKKKPVDIDDATGKIQNAVLLLRVRDHCDFRQNDVGDDARCAVCRQIRAALVPASPGYKPRLWTQRDTRGDLAIAKKIAAKNVLEANKLVPCPRGSASNPVLAPISKRTRSINWERNYGIRAQQHNFFKANARIERETLRSRGETVPFFPDGTALGPEHPETKRRQRRRAAREKRLAERQGNSGESLRLTPKAKETRPPPESTTDEVVHILSTAGGGPLCHFETPLSARIAGTNTRIRHADGKSVLRERIRLCSRTLLHTQRELRLRARDRIAGREAPPWGAGSREARRLQKVAKRVAARWLRAGLVATLEKWKAFVVQRRHDREVVRRWLVTVENIELTKGWRSWGVFVEECRVNESLSAEELLKKKWASMKKREEDAKCRRVVLRMLHAKLTAGWGAWQEYVRVMRMLTRIGTRMMRRGMVKCLNQWKEWLAQRRIDQAIVRSWLFSVENRELMGGWRGWVAFVRWQKRSEEMEGAEAPRLKKHQYEVCHRCFSKMLHVKTLSAVNTWKGWVRDKRLMDRMVVGY